MRFPAAVAMLLLVASCGGGDRAGEIRGQSGADLWGRTFVSVAVTEGGEPRPLVAGTRIEVTFEDREGGGVARWEAGCNVLGSRIEITSDRILLTEPPSGTDVGCRDELHEQDEWLTDFFESDPFWKLTDARLALASGETTIQLEERN